MDELRSFTVCNKNQGKFDPESDCIVWSNPVGAFGGHLYFESFFVPLIDDFVTIVIKTTKRAGSAG